MGQWGAGLYQGDDAADLKNLVGLAVRVTGDGQKLLGIIREAADPVLLAEPFFWLVVADQFERRGLRCDEAAARALEVIESRADLERMREHGLSTRDLQKREREQAGLADRLRSPRPEVARKVSARPPAIVVAPGEVYAFRTMNGNSANAWFPDPTQHGFAPNGRGALIIVATGRAFGWLPWCAVHSVAVDPDREPDLESVRAARILLHPQMEGAPKCVPNAGHLRRMQAERIGSLALDPARAAAAVARMSDAQAIAYGWSISSMAFGDNGRRATGEPVASILAG